MNALQILEAAINEANKGTNDNDDMDKWPTVLNEAIARMCQMHNLDQDDVWSGLDRGYFFGRKTQRN